MKAIQAGIICLVILAVSATAWTEHRKAAAPKETQCSVRVYFSPKGGCRDALIAEINNAQKTIFFQIYTFTSKDIGNALLAAKRRGVTVQGVWDSKGSDAKGSQKGALQQAEVAIRLDKKHQIMHDKVAIIDGKVVITGSYNWTNAAENDHAENLLVITSEDVAKTYTDDWQAHWDHSEDHK